MNLHSLFQGEIERHQKAFNEVSTKLEPVFVKWVEKAKSCLDHGGKIVFFGNGGSASDAQHLATELTVRYVKNRKAMPALSLATDTSALTAIGNDFGFEDLFSRQVEALCKPEDMVIGISTSGTSPNVIKALNNANEIGCVTVGFGGRDGGKLPEICDISIVVPAHETASIQEMHILLGHAFCQALENTCLEENK